jgi:hypothetical protein
LLIRREFEILTRRDWERALVYGARPISNKRKYRPRTDPPVGMTGNGPLQPLQNALIQRTCVVALASGICHYAPNFLTTNEKVVGYG